MQSDEFTELLWQQARTLYRNMPWRDDVRPYYVLVSEMMLQQTQVARVVPKFTSFIEAFPDEAALAAADLADVLVRWQGLGYNRRAKFLHDAAKRIITHHGGVFPQRTKDILDLPGVGVNTCGAIEAYAFNRPVVYVETNVRTVYIHHFFNDDTAVDDTQIRDKLQQTLDTEHPREFYWALMDYGSWLKRSGIRNVSQSKHFKKQPALEGSVRQMRGAIIRRLADGPLRPEQLMKDVAADERFEPALTGLVRDGLVTKAGRSIRLTK